MKNYIFLLFILIYSCSDKSHIEKKTTSSLYEKAWDYFNKGENVKAFVLFEKAKDTFLKNNDSVNVGKCLTNMAIILNEKGDNFGSIEVSLEAIKYFDEANKDHFYYILSNYNNLGFANYNLKNYPKALSFYNNGISFAEDSLSKQIALNNKANTYRELKDYTNALNIYNSILTKNKENKIEYARALANLAFTKWLQNPDYNPVPEFQKALKIRLKEKDNWGLNSSYAHFADYYTKNQQDSALFYSRKMYDISKEIESPDDQVEALQKLISLESSQNSKQYFNVYQKLNDSLQTARNKAKNQFALIRYETEKHKADFLKAKAESAERQNKIIVRNIALIVASIVLIGFYIYLRKRQKRLQQEKLLEVKNTELKYSKKVHDVVANGLYHTMIEIQNQPELDKEKILNRIEKMYEESRDIAQEEITAKDFYARFYKMINSYSSNDQRILPVGYKDNIWENLSDNVQSELYYIIREILVNMKKHSQANLASLKFKRDQDNLTIRYTDNGLGISDLKSKKGTGIRNTENRIDAIDGDIIFEKNPKGGLIILITVPTHPKYV